MYYVTFRVNEQTRQLPDTDATWNYLHKLSFASTVYIDHYEPDDSLPFYIECGETFSNN